MSEKEFDQKIIGIIDKLSDEENDLRLISRQSFEIYWEKVC